MENLEAFDWHRIFIGDLPSMFLLEIVVRTLIMYLYTIFLLRILGKRGMGQLSSLEVSIIICFGSAIGDPMLGFEIPVTHGLVAVTTIAVVQVMMEHYINRHKKVEELLEGTADRVVDNGLIVLEQLAKENISHEDLFRSLRNNNVRHLGQIDKAYFETSGQVSVIFLPDEKIRPGLSVLPPEQIPENVILQEHEVVKKTAIYCCTNCGNPKHYRQSEDIISCKICSCSNWIEAEI